MKRIINILIIVITLSYLPDLIGLYSHNIKSLSTISNIKYIREFLLIITSCFIVFKSIYNSKKILKNSGPFLIFIIISIMILLINVISFNFKSTFIIKPITSILILFALTNQSKIFASNNLLKALFFTHVGLQIIESIFLPNPMSFNLLGLNVRSTGIMPMPSSAAIVSILLGEILNHINCLNKKIIGLLTFFSIILSASGLGLVVFLYLTIRKTKYIKYLTIPFLVFLLIMAPTILGRADLMKSIEDRFVNWTTNFEKIKIINLNTSGLFTNSNAAYERSIGNNWEVYVTDGDFLSILLNMGIIPFLTYLFALFVQIIHSKSHQKKYWVALILFSLTMNFLEFSIAVLLFAILLNLDKINIKKYIYKSNLILSE